MIDRPLKRDYARVEIERRFRLLALPPGVAADDYTRLRDLFVVGTGLRIRRVETPDGTELVTKLGQKRVDPIAPDDPRRRLLTTIYLAPGEAAPLAPLSGPRSCKRRYTVRHGGWTWAIDVWEEPAHCAGLILAEVECPSDAELAEVDVPAWAHEEVTLEPSFSAFALATGVGVPDGGCDSP